MKILLLEDDIFLGDLVREHLQERGFEVVLCSDGEDTYERIQREHFDILLLDINVPGIKGSELLQLLRQQKINTPAIFITSLNSAQDVQEGFAIGADDYIKKPFEFEELDARLEHLIKIYRLDQKSFALGDIRFYPDKKLLIKGDEPINLSTKETQLLHYFFTHPNRTITKEELIANLWEDIPTDATIRTYIKMLREHFGEAIRTVRGIGYEFVLP